MSMRLSDICEINPKAEVLDDNTLISFVAMSDVSEDGKIKADTLRPYSEVKKGFTCFKEGDVLFAKITPCMENGKGALSTDLKNGVGFGSTEFHVLRPDPTLAFGQWLYYLTAWSGFRKNAEKHMTGSAGQKRVPKSFLEKYEVHIPTIEDQKHQALQLNRIRKIIDARKQQLTALDGLIKARFVEMFGDPSMNTKGYPIKSLSEIANYWNGLTYKPEDVADKGTIVLRSSNIQNAQLDFEDTVRVACRIGEKKYVQENDILMCSRNGSARLVGKVALIKNINEPMSFGAFMMIIRSQYYPYLMTYFQMPAFRAQITTGATTTINQITGRMLDNVKLPVPEKTELESFISFIEQVDKSKVAVQRALDEAQLLFDSLMQEYFG